MAFVSEVIAKMRVDKSEVDGQLTAVAASFAKAGDAIDKQLSKGFGFRKMAKGLLQGIGIGSASDIKEAITKPFEDAAKAAKEIEESTARTLKIYESIFEGRRTDEQNLEFNRRQQASLQKELAKLNEPQKVIESTLSATGKVTLTERAVPQTAEQKKRADEIAEELATLFKEEERLTKAIGKEQKANDDRRMKAADDFANKQEDLAQQQNDFLRSQMTLEDQLAEIEKERLDLAERMSMSDEDTVDLERRELELLKEIARIEKEISTEAERQAKQYRNTAKEIFKAGEAVTKAREDYATEFRDRSAMTLAEVANQRVNASARNAARQIQKYEERAKRIRLEAGYQPQAEMAKVSTETTGTETQDKKIKSVAKVSQKVTDLETKAEQITKKDTEKTIGETKSDQGERISRKATDLEIRSEQAKRAQSEFRDYSGKVLSREEYADQLMNKADKMRRGLGMLTAKERDPMAMAAESIKRSEEHLQNIDGYLKPSEIR